ncbi:pantoate--beta-alanine ligase [Paraneptunicella aestuarii]|uniref:pantoate--beta-alanine ligase n=1 Tax=Paraneptunicella aestuarii TaxID=2831148 RepID=UPI001E5EDF5B|nr:pantoate--beta-alanine ligase [Paraneptunicella aestuarii]UAA38520.1 pantoate--beta-alanine ligase [Paraneptunicella aestuarii]
MQVINEILPLREQRRKWQIEGKVIGFVPTMGNLHDGHLDLVRRAREKCDVVVVSIFVNPMQFGPNEDLDAYPRTMDADCKALEALGVNCVFVPKVEDIYARGLEQQTFVEVPGLSYMICGASRPGHFRGVATIVCKLFNMVQPNHAFFGEKDFQQLQVIKGMVQDLSMNLTIHGVPTRREEDGLAMSSRNNYLSVEERQRASRIYETISLVADAILQGRRDFTALIAEHKALLNQSGFKVDYIEIRSASTLLHPSHEEKNLVILCAAFLGKTRLIDNIQVDLD